MVDTHRLERMKKAAAPETATALGGVDRSGRTALNGRGQAYTEAWSQR